jgi:uroporphyrin-III C-methyltransferase
MTELPAPERPEIPAVAVPVVNPAPRSTMTLLLGLILLAILVLFAVAIWRLHDRTQLAERNEAVLQEAVAELRRDLTENLRTQAMTLASVQEKLAQQQGSHEDLRALVAGGAESFAEAQRRHAAEYFVQQANQRLTLNQDVPGAIAALDAGTQELISSKLPANQDLRKRMLTDRQKLAALRSVDVLAVARQLADLQNIVNGLQPLGPNLENQRYLLPTDEHQTGWLGDLKTTWAQFSGDWFLVRKHDQEVSSPPDANEGRRVKLALSLALAEARLAALQHDTTSYQEALARAERLLAQYYANAEGSESLRKGLQNLQQQAVTIDGEVKLSALTITGAQS